MIQFNTNYNSLVEYNATATGKQKIPIKFLSNIIKDTRGEIWVGGDNLLGYIDDATQRFKPWFTLPKNFSSSPVLGTIAEPADPDIIWMNTYQDSSYASFHKELLGKTLLQLRQSKVSAFSIERTCC